MSTDIRWSFDPRTDELFVWDSENGRQGHYQKFGQEGYENCAQGRLQEIKVLRGRKDVLDSYYATIYGDRPFAFGEEEEAKSESIRERSKAALQNHFEPYPVHWQLTL